MSWRVVGVGVLGPKPGAESFNVLWVLGASSVKNFQKVSGVWAFVVLPLRGCRSSDVAISG